MMWRRGHWRLATRRVATGSRTTPRTVGGPMNLNPTRRSVLQSTALTSFALAAGANLLRGADAPPGEKILGESGVKSADRPQGRWQPVSDRKVRVGIAG